MTGPVLVHADGGACHGTPVVDGRCPKCGIAPDTQSVELWSSGDPTGAVRTDHDPGDVGGVVSSDGPFVLSAHDADRVVALLHGDPPATTEYQRRHATAAWATEYQRRHAIAAWEDEMEHAAANKAVYDGILAKLKARQHPCFAPTEVFEVLYIDGEPHRVYLDAKGVMRFCGNPVVRRILDASAYTLNDVARGDHSRRDVQRLYIEIGYSVDGFLGLSMNNIIHLSLTPPTTAP